MRKALASIGIFALFFVAGGDRLSHSQPPSALPSDGKTNKQPGKPKLSAPGTPRSENYPSRDELNGLPNPGLLPPPYNASTHFYNLPQSYPPNMNPPAGMAPSYPTYSQPYVPGNSTFDQHFVPAQTQHFVPAQTLGGFYQPAQSFDPEELTKFQTALNRFRSARNEEDKATARDEVKALVSKQLERDIENRDKMLTDLENRIKDMRVQLEERKKSKDEISKMFLLMIEQPQLGLGLPREWMNAIEPNRYMPAVGQQFVDPQRPKVFSNSPVIKKSIPDATGEESPVAD